MANAAFIGSLSPFLIVPIGAKLFRKYNHPRALLFAVLAFGGGWAYTLVPMFLTGVAAHGLLVFAQRTIQIGTIGIVQVAQPAPAVVWSFLLLDERVRPWQVVGIAVVMGGLVGFLVLNDRGSRARRAADPGDAVIAASETSGPAVLPSPRVRRFGRRR